jgi:hypothetical protein
MVLNATFKKISVLLVEETRVPAGNHRPATSHWQNLSHNVVSSTPPEFELTTLVVIGTDCIDSCESNYHTIKTTMAPINLVQELVTMLVCYVA